MLSIHHSERGTIKMKTQPRSPTQELTRKLQFALLTSDAPPTSTGERIGLQKSGRILGPAFAYMNECHRATASEQSTPRKIARASEIA